MQALVHVFEETVLPHLDAAYKLARWLTRNEGDAEDVVQEAFLRALRHFHTFKGGDARPWLLVIVRNTYYTWRKHILWNYLTARIDTPSPLLNIPATQPVISVAKVAASNARKPRLARSSRREGARAAVPPTKIAIAATCANPQRA